MNKLIGAMVLVAGLAFGDAGDPPARVARLNYLSGSVSFQPAGVDDWSPATINYPMTTGDHLWVDNQSRAEMHIGSTVIHADSGTASSFLNLDDRTVQIRLSQGSLYIRIRYMADDDVYEVDTPNGAISLLRTGSYRIDVEPDRETTAITVRGGEAEVTAGGSAFAVRPREIGIVTGSDVTSSDLRAASPLDSFDTWCMAREHREDDRPAAQYVSRELPGIEDLDDYGDWRPDPGYGMVWVPRVDVGWAPYHNGHWRWIEPWGWTWVDDAPWGFAPFHYGRWAMVGGRWGWIPGPGVAVVAARPGFAVVSQPVFRPVYAPALVAFVGGNNWSVSLSIGGGGGVAWFPLGPREVYMPAYHVSPAYVNRVNVVNVTNVTNVTNITNINTTNVRYVNQTVPGAVTAVSRNDFTSAAPVQRAAFRVPPSVVASAPVAGSAPSVAPRFQSVAPAAGGNIPRPPFSAANRTVMTKTAPPPPPVSFASRQTALNANPGRPVDQRTLSSIQQSNPTPHPLVRSAFTPAPPASGGFRPANSTPTPNAPVNRPAFGQTQTPNAPPVNRPAFGQTQTPNAPVNRPAPVPEQTPSAPVNRRTFEQTPPPSAPRPVNQDRPADTQRDRFQQPPAPRQSPPPPPRVNTPEPPRQDRVVRQERPAEKPPAQKEPPAQSEKDKEKEKDRRQR